MRIPLALVAATGTALVLNVAGAFAYTSGSTGYDIGYLQCGNAYPSGAFGIVGVDSGWPFISSLHPGNPCLASQFAASTNPGMYVNTGFDPSYTDSNHTTSSCATLSGNITGTASQQAAWAAGCSEASKDLAYVQSQSVGTPAGWWLDVETANSWCGQFGTNCKDLSLNQYTIQGLIDTFRVNSSAAVGIYSNRSMWSAITGGLTVNGAIADWVAPGLTSSKRISRYCGSSWSFSGQPVKLVQWVQSSTDRDYAC